MSAEQVSLVREGYHAWNRGDRSWVLEHMAPDVEWVTPPDDPDFGTYHGHEGVGQFWDQWRAAVGQLHFEPLEVIDEEPHVIVVTRRTGRGEQSGAEIADEVVQVFSFGEDGRVFRVQEFYDRDQALAAARTASSHSSKSWRRSTVMSTSAPRSPARAPEAGSARQRCRRPPRSDAPRG